MLVEDVDAIGHSFPIPHFGNHSFLSLFSPSTTTLDGSYGLPFPSIPIYFSSSLRHLQEADARQGGS